MGKPLEYPVRTRAGVWASRLVARPKSFVKILEFFFADFDVSSYLKIEIFLENFWILFFWSAGRPVGGVGVGLGSAGVQLDRSWAPAGRGLKQDLAQAELEISWDGLG